MNGFNSLSSRDAKHLLQQTYQQLLLMGWQEQLQDCEHVLLEAAAACWREPLANHKADQLCPEWCIAFSKVSSRRAAAAEDGSCSSCWPLGCLS